MKFGPAKLADAVGGVTVHAVRQGSLVLKKGTTIGSAEIEALERAGVAEIVVARLEDDDVSEDVAAARIARRIAGTGINVERAVTGRANLFAAHAGILMLDREAVERINGVDEAITLATLPVFKAVVAGEMVATVKLIPFGVPRSLCEAAIAVSPPSSMRIVPYVVKKVGIVSTILPGLPAKVIEKTLRVTRERLSPTGATVTGELRVLHDERALAIAIRELIDLGAELVIVFGASAIADRRDVIPAAIERIGGRIECFGMPVDPGNLLLIGNAGSVAVLGAPGCARSPAKNGFDWVLMRRLAGLQVSRADLIAMGVGGLLMEIIARHQPRAPTANEGSRSIAAIILAAGRSTRMEGSNKLLVQLHGETMVRIVAEQALASRASSVIVVTGHQGDEVEQSLRGLDLRFVRNDEFAQGLASSIRAGIRAVPPEAEGAIICLGDMPLIDANLIDRLIDALSTESGQMIVVPVRDGRRGNPVLWSRRLFGELMTLDGDVGARHLVGLHEDVVVEIAVDGAAAFLDVDTPEALAELQLA